MTNVALFGACRIGKIHAGNFRAHFCHSAPMEMHASGFRLRANAPEGPKPFSISQTPGQRPGGPKAISYQSIEVRAPGGMATRGVSVPGQPRRTR